MFGQGQAAAQALPRYRSTPAHLEPLPRVEKEALLVKHQQHRRRDVTAVQAQAQELHMRLRIHAGAPAVVAAALLLLFPHVTAELHNQGRPGDAAVPDVSQACAPGWGAQRRGRWLELRPARTASWGAAN